MIQLFDPERDTRGHRDVPCTLGYRFFLCGGRLHMHTTIRSQDLWLGFPYDVFAATLLQELLAGWLGIELGEYHHHVDSLHLYEKHAKAATSCGSPGPTRTATRRGARRSATSTSISPEPWRGGRRGTAVPSRS
ncbi:MAG: thymidylate synthase [Actinomycetota bacterium]|nr:thymidylate synthase [Actinomycetota bacterium]